MSKQTFLQLGAGIDISKDDFRVCLMGSLPERHTKILASSRFGNTAAGFEKFWQWLQKHLSKHSISCWFVVEATGVYHENLTWFLYEKAQQISVVLPNQAKYFMKSEGLKSKTDKIDAQGLAKMVLVKKLRIWKPVSPVLRKLRTQTRYYEALQKELTRHNNRLHALLHSYEPDTLTQKMVEKSIAFLNTQISLIKKSMLRIVKKDQALYQKINRLTTIPGVGMVSAIVVVAETNGFALFTSRKQLTSFVGYDVIENQSGKRTGKTKISKKGNTHIRRILYFPSISAVDRAKANNSFKTLYHRVFERTKIKMKGYTAVQRKILCLMFTLWKNEEDFDPKEDQKKAEESETLLHEIAS